MLDSRKVEVLLQWLGCFNIKVTKLSELGDGLQLLKLLSAIEPECATENVAPAKAFAQVEQILIGSSHGSLPAGFLSSASKGGCRDVTLAVAAALALSSVVLHGMRRDAGDDLAPLLALDETAQSFIKDVVQIVSAGDSVIKNLRSFLGAASTEAGPSDVISPPPSHARKSESFTFSPTSVESPRKTPERRPLVPMQQKEIQLLMEHIREEEEASAKLQAEVSLLKKTLRGKDKEIQRQRERLATLEDVSSDDASCLEQQRERIQHLECQNSRLQEQVLAMQKVREDYDDLIRQNVALEHENQQLANREEEKKDLEGRLAAALSHELELQAQLSASEEARASLASAMAEQERDLESLREFCASRQEARLPSLDSSPQTPRTPVERRGATCCFQELHLAELEEDNARLRRELDEKAAQQEAESAALRATVAQLEEARDELNAQLSRLTQDCAQQNLRITELQRELLESKSLAAELEPRRAVEEGCLDVLNHQAVHRSSAACDACELLESVDLDLASRSLEAAGGDLGATLTEVAGGGESSSSALPAVDVDSLQPPLRESDSSPRLSRQPSNVEREDDGQSCLPSHEQRKPVSTGVAGEPAQALVKDLEGLCSELLVGLADAQGRLEAVGEENDALVKIKEEVQRANAILRAQLDEAVLEKATASATLEEQKGSIARLEEEKILATENAGKLETDLKLLECERSKLFEKIAELEQQLSRATQSREELHAKLCLEHEQIQSVAKQEVSILREAVVRMDLEKQFLHWSLMSAENASHSLRATSQTADQNSRHKLKDRCHNNEQPSCLVTASSEMTGKLSDWKQEPSDTTKELSHTNEGLSDVKELLYTHDNSSKLPPFVVEPEDQTVLLHQKENRALRVRVGELEAKLTDQTELQSVEEGRARIEVLQRHRDQLASKAVRWSVCELESGQLRELLCEADHSRDAATSRIRELEEARRRLELDLAERERRLAEVGARCQILENKNTGLKMELESLRTKVRRNTQEAASNAAAMEASHREEVDEWKQRLDKERALRLRRETLLMQHAREKAQKLERDAEQLESQLAEKSAELVTAAKERTRLAAENRSLKAQLSYCDAKLRDSLERGRSSRGRASAANASLYSTPSLDSLWSQRPADTRQNSLASVASERSPALSNRPGGTSLDGERASSAEMTPGITSQLPNRFSERHPFRGEAPEEEVFDRSLGSLKPPSEENSLERLSELHRRNSLVPLHLRSCYPVEMQDKPLPPNALTADSSLPAFPSRVISSPAPPDVGVGRQSRRGTEGAPSITRGVEGSSSSSRSDRRWV